LKIAVDAWNELYYMSSCAYYGNECAVSCEAWSVSEQYGVLKILGMGEKQIVLEHVSDANGMVIAIVHGEPTTCVAACTQQTLVWGFSSTLLSKCSSTSTLFALPYLLQSTVEGRTVSVSLM
jgi:hypothetical protein